MSKIEQPLLEAAEVLTHLQQLCFKNWFTMFQSSIQKVTCKLRNPFQHIVRLYIHVKFCSSSVTLAVSFSTQAIDHNTARSAVSQHLVLFLVVDHLRCKFVEP